MVKQVIFFLCSVLLLFTGSACTRVAMVLLGAKKPKTETAESVAAFAQEYNFDLKNTYVCSTSFYQALQAQKLIKPGGTAAAATTIPIPALLAFNSKGEGLNLYNPSNCIPGTLGILNRLRLENPEQTLKLPQPQPLPLPLSLRTASPELLANVTPHDSTAYLITADLPDFLHYFSTLDGTAAAPDQVLDGSDIYIGFIWASFWPKRMKEVHRDLLKLQQLRPDLKIKILYMNCDKREEEPEQQAKAH